MRAAAIAAARRRGRTLRSLTYLAILGAVAWSIQVIVIADTDWARLAAGSAGKTLASFLEFDYKLLPELVDPAIETVLMATLATLGGLLLAIPVAWLGAANISPSGAASYVVGRFLMTVSRSVHEIVWGLIFVSAVGLGALAGILAMAVRSVGFISKIIAEAIEDVQPGPIEAIRAVGGNQFQVLLYAHPAADRTGRRWATMIFEWDINIRRSTIMGLVGAGGLGLVLLSSDGDAQLRRRRDSDPRRSVPDPPRRDRLALCAQSRHLSPPQ